MDLKLLANWGVFEVGMRINHLNSFTKIVASMVQGFPKFLAGGEFRCFKIKQIELIQKFPTTLISESFWMKTLPLDSH